MQIVQKDNNRFKELDALRGIAAVLVVFFHLTIGREEAKLGFNLGTTGVDLFFMISGFVISLSINAVSKDIQFVINRVSRLYPTYCASVTLTFVLIAAYNVTRGEPIVWMHYFANMTMFQYYFSVPDLDPSYWTMIVEMNFYLFILLLFQLNLLRVVIPLCLSITVVIAVVTNFFWNDITQQIFSFLPLLKFFPLFFAGIIFYKWKTKAQKRYSYFWMLLICFLTQLQLYGIASGRSTFFLSYTEYGVMLMVYFVVFLLFVHNKLGFLATRPLLFLGKISFALYLTHQSILVGHVMPFLLNKLGLNFWVASIFICLPLAISIAASITYLIEVPLSAKMKNWLTGKLLPRTILTS